jgi:iron complex outermembrane recepter protein
MKFLLLLLFLPSILKAQVDSSIQKNSDTIFTKMEEVIFKEQSNYIKNESDKTILQLDGRPSLTGMNALELLKQSPGVVVDPGENILMGGKSGVVIYIDNKPSQLSGQDLAQVLKSIDASNIKSIELISNPSARYDAAGNAGIINILLKKSLQNGFNGNINGSYVQSIHSRQNAGANFNFRKNNWNIFFNGSGYNGFQNTIANTDRILQDFEIIQRSLERDKFYGATTRTGIDYRINKLQTVGVTWMHNRKYSGMDNRSTSLIKGTGNDSSVNTRSIAPFKNDRNVINLNYSISKNKTKLSADADYIFYQSSLNNEIQNSFVDERLENYKNTQSRFNQSHDIQVKSLQVDLVSEIGKWKVEGGIKSIATSTDNKLRVQDNKFNNWITDTLRTNFFDFKENISAVYGSIKRDIKKFTFQFGLRTEYSKVRGITSDLKVLKLHKPDTSYLNFFPTFYTVFRMAADHSLGLVLNRRIDRPAYQEQNPFIYALDAFNYEQGNPYLTPQFSNAIEISYTYKYATSLKIKYAETKNYIEQLTFQDGKNTVLIPQNAGTRKMLNIVISSPIKINNWWNLYGFAEPFFQNYKINLEGFGLKEIQKNKSWGFNSYLSSTISLPKKWKLDLSYWYNFQNRTTIYTSKPLSSLNLGIQKILANEKLVLKCAVTDMFNDQKWEQSARTSNLNLLSYRKWESRNVTISVSFRFGNDKIKGAREREIDATERISDSR